MHPASGTSGPGAGCELQHRGAAESDELLAGAPGKGICISALFASGLIRV